MKKLPLKMVLEIHSTNLSTRQCAIEKVTETMIGSAHRLPKAGQIMWDERFKEPYWKVKVVEVVNYLETPKSPKNPRKRRA